MDVADSPLVVVDTGSQNRRKESKNQEKHQVLIKKKRIVKSWKISTKDHYYL